MLLRRSGNSSVGRAQPCQGWGREFESRFPLQAPSDIEKQTSREEDQRLSAMPAHGRRHRPDRPRLSGRVVMQRPAKPCTPVRFRPQPPHHPLVEKQAEREEGRRLPMPVLPARPELEGGGGSGKQQQKSSSATFTFTRRLSILPACTPGWRNRQTQRTRQGPPRGNPWVHRGQIRGTLNRSS